MKRVSFKVAQVIKDCGYPQDYTKCDVWFSSDGKVFNCTEDYSDCYARPTYIEVWLWLWRVKKIHFCPYHQGIEVEDIEGEYWQKFAEVEKLYFITDPEEAIIAAIEYLVDNNLIE